MNIDPFSNQIMYSNRVNRLFILVYSNQDASSKTFED